VTRRVKRLQIYIEESVDGRLEVEAARRGSSKAAIVREAVGAYLGEAPEGDDPLDGLVGSVDAGPVDDLDEVICG
jgi:hypothetical protein